MPRVNLFVRDQQTTEGVYRYTACIYIYIFFLKYIECERQQLVGVVRGYKV